MGSHLPPLSSSIEVFKIHVGIFASQNPVELQYSWLVPFSSNPVGTRQDTFTVVPEDLSYVSKSSESEFVAVIMTCGSAITGHWTIMNLKCEMWKTQLIFNKNIYPLFILSTILWSTNVERKCNRTIGQCAFHIILEDYLCLVK